MKFEIKYLGLFIGGVFLAAFISSCNNDHNVADGYGNFEADEVVISAKLPGELIAFKIEEGQTYSKGENVGYIDTLALHLQRAELNANKQAVASRITSVMAQLAVLKDEKANIEREQKRITKLVEAGAATTQQLDDLDGKIQVVNSKIKSTRSQNPAIVGQVEAIEAKVAQLENQISNSKITVPENGVVLHKIAEEHEYTAPGKPLFKMADISVLNVRVYLPQTMMTSIQLNQNVKIKVDGNTDEMLTYDGVISWISSEAEFTPKTIQTKEDRVDLVYAVKVSVKNDGKLKIGMPAELWLSEE